MQAENEALQQLVLDVAQNKQEAQRKVASLKQKYGTLLAKVQRATQSYHAIDINPPVVLLQKQRRCACWLAIVAVGTHVPCSCTPDQQSCLQGYVPCLFKAAAVGDMGVTSSFAYGHQGTFIMAIQTLHIIYNGRTGQGYVGLYVNHTCFR